MFANTREIRARDCMSAPVISVRPDESARRAAELMIAHRISGLPVVDADGFPVGLVSEADFVFGMGAALERRREAWLRMISGGQAVNPDYLDLLQRELGAVRQFMAAPVVSVDEDAPLGDVVIAMADHRIRRVIVTREGRVAGVVTRRDLLRVAAPEAVEPSPRPHAVVAAPAPAPPAPPPRPAVTDGDISAKAFRALVAAHESAEQALRAYAAAEARRLRDAAVAELMKAPLTEAEWRGMIALARIAAAKGERQCAILRFPAALCEDGGRAVNLPDPDWPATLRGKAALTVLRWRDELKPAGFRLAAQVVSFPGGLPGDVELSLVWGG